MSSVSLKPLNEQVMVITGASSGIGLATAREAAHRGAKVVLASRNEQALSQIVSELKSEGLEAIHVVADVSNRDDLELIAERAIDNFGCFDTWVNNAAVSIYGKLEEVDEEDHRRLFEVNFWGMVNGSLVALRHLKQHGGALINLGSVASDLAIPLQGMYSASKHAVKAFTDALRMELQEENAPVSVTLIKPTSINTPFPQHAKNYMEEEPKLPPPVYPPEEVARAICYAAAHPKRDIYIGSAAKLMSASSKIAPRTTDRINQKVFTKEQKSDQPARHYEGSLYAPGDDGSMHGNLHGSFARSSSVYTRASLHPFLTGAMIITGGIGLITALEKKR